MIVFGDLISIQDYQETVDEEVAKKYKHEHLEWKLCKKGSNNTCRKNEAVRESKIEILTGKTHQQSENTESTVSKNIAYRFVCLCWRKYRC